VIAVLNGVKTVSPLIGRQKQNPDDGRQGLLLTNYKPKL